ncbi:hypothetical protein [Microlunatus sp. Y2014]|uniref:MinD/ParA family ATP-binding protein n=1 Tax=Microlunatus sp. Y2014 TaxID=3418488 RepID=UPI003DA7551A
MSQADGQRPEPDAPISQTPWSNGLQDLGSWERQHARQQTEGQQAGAPANPFTRPRRGRTDRPAAPLPAPDGEDGHQDGAPRRSAPGSPATPPRPTGQRPQVQQGPPAQQPPRFQQGQRHQPAPVPQQASPVRRPAEPQHQPSAPQHQPSGPQHQPSAPQHQPSAPQQGWPQQPAPQGWGQPQQPQTQPQQPQTQPQQQQPAARPEPYQQVPPSHPAATGTPSYSANDLIEQLNPQSAVRARRGLRGRLGLAPSAKEQAEAADEEAVRTPFPRPVTIMIANPKGGVGKTPTTLMLAAAFGVVRGGGVCAWDNNELRGTMPDRSLSPHRRTVRDLLAARDELSQPQSQFTELAYFLNHQTSGKFHTLGSAQNYGHVISKEDFELIHGILTRYFQIVIVDTGNNEASPNWLAAAHSADCLVVPTKWRKDSLIPAARMLETLAEERPELLPRTVVVATNGPMDTQEDVRRNAANWFGPDQQIVEIPTDPHVAEGGVIEYTKLRPRTKRQMLRLAAQVAQVLTTAAAESPVKGD